MLYDESLTDEERDFYGTALQLSKEGPTSTGYGMGVNQDVRFRAFTDALDRILAPEDGYTLLDVGCGTGDLAAHLAAVGVEPTRYVGVDRDERMVKTANDRFEAFDACRFFVADGVSAHQVLRRAGEDTMFDVVDCIATLAMKPPDWDQAQVLHYVQKQIDNMVLHTEKLLFVTLFSPWKNKILPNEMLVDPAYMLNWAIHNFGRAEVIHSYAPHDYALVIPMQEGKWWEAYGVS